MVSENFSKGFQLLGRVYYLAVLPFLVDLFFLINRVLQSLSPNTFRLGVKFSFPIHFPSLTDVYSFPTTAGFQVSFPFSQDSVPIALLSAVIALLIVAYLAAGYLATINTTRQDEFHPFTQLAAKYFPHILLYGLFWFIIILLGVLLSLITPLLLSFYILSFFILYYFIYLTPFAIITDNLTFTQALNQSLTLTLTQASKTLPYTLLYLVATALISIPVYLIMNLGVIGFILAAAGYAFLGTGLAASTLYLYVDVTKPYTPPYSTPITQYLPFQPRRPLLTYDQNMTCDAATRDRAERQRS